MFGDLCFAEMSFSSISYDFHDPWAEVQESSILWDNASSASNSWTEVPSSSNNWSQ